MMNTEILLPYHRTNSANSAISSHDEDSPESTSFVLSPRHVIDEPSRMIVKRTITPPSNEINKASCCASPPSPTCVTQVICDEPLLDHFAETAAATTLQAMIRGTLARWNFQVLKLQHKLASIHALKERQLKKLKQRTEQTKRTLRTEIEYSTEHRSVRRRLRRAKCLRNQYAQEKVLTLELNQHLKEQCQTLQASNDECAGILRTYIQSMEVAQYNLNVLNMNRQHLEATCETYRTILEVFQEQVVVTEDDEHDEEEEAVEEP